MVSLYTTSTREEELKKQFQMNDFYTISIQKGIQKRTILKYFVKNEE